MTQITALPACCRKRTALMTFIKRPLGKQQADSGGVYAEGKGNNRPATARGACFKQLLRVISGQSPVMQQATDCLRGKAPGEPGAPRRATYIRTAQVSENSESDASSTGMKLARISLFLRVSLASTLRDRPIDMPDRFSRSSADAGHVGVVTFEPGRMPRYKFSRYALVENHRCRRSRDALPRRASARSQRAV